MKIHDVIKRCYGFKINLTLRYSAIVGITPSALKERLSGKLNGSFIKSSEFFYASPAIDGPNKDTFAPINSRSKQRRRHVPSPRSNIIEPEMGTNYTSNDIKQLWD